MAERFGQASLKVLVLIAILYTHGQTFIGQTFRILH